MAGMSGSIKSAAHKMHWSLPPKNICLDIRDVFDRKRVWSEDNDPMPPVVLARRLVGAALGSKSPFEPGLGSDSEWDRAGSFARLTWRGLGWAPGSRTPSAGEPEGRVGQTGDKPEGRGRRRRCGSHGEPILVGLHIS